MHGLDPEYQHNRWYQMHALVSQVEKSPKPQASCAMPAGPGMKIKTDSPIVKKAREGVMEFLLVGHRIFYHFDHDPLCHSSSLWTSKIVDFE